MSYSCRGLQWCCWQGGKCLASVWLIRATDCTGRRVCLCSVISHALPYCEWFVSECVMFMSVSNSAALSSLHRCWDLIRGSVEAETSSQSSTTKLSHASPTRIQKQRHKISQGCCGWGLSLGNNSFDRLWNIKLRAAAAAVSLSWAAPDFSWAASRAQL